MEPRSNQDTRLHRPAPEAQTHDTLPPHGDDAHFSYPATPPPTYSEAVQPDPFPVLTPPSVPPEASVAAPHPPTHGRTAPTPNGVTPAAFDTTPPPSYEDAVGCVQSQPASVSQSATIPLTELSDAPGVVRCTYCNHVGVTVLSHEPGALSYCLCVLLLILGGVFFGYFVLPLILSSLQDVHHSCSRCDKHLHTFVRGRC